MRNRRKQLIKKCKRKLLELKKHYSKILKGPVEISSGGDLAYMAHREEQIHSTSSIKGRFHGLLGEIDAALKRIQEGTYGLCAISGEEIEDKRLQAIPWTQVSIQALEEREIS